MEKDEGGWIAAQTMATVSGLSYLEPTSHLCMHPTYGAWHSLQAVIILDGISIDVPPPMALSCAMSDASRRHVAECMSKVLNSMQGMIHHYCS